MRSIKDERRGRSERQLAPTRTGRGRRSKENKSRPDSAIEQQRTGTIKAAVELWSPYTKSHESQRANDLSTKKGAREMGERLTNMRKGCRGKEKEGGRRGER